MSRLEHLRRVMPLMAAMVVLVLSATVHAQFQFTTNNNALTVTLYTGADGTVIIPARTNGLPIVAIGDYAFNRRNITNLTIPDGIITIGNYAFEQCVILPALTVPDTVTSIGTAAFAT